MSRCASPFRVRLRQAAWLRLAVAAQGRSPRSGARRATLLALASLALAGCHDLHTSYTTDTSRMYLERRELVSAGAGDAVAANKVLQMRDPWPIASADRNLPMHGHVAAAAVERYRTGKVIPPVGMRTSSSGYGAQPQAGQGSASSMSAVPQAPSAAGGGGAPAAASAPAGGTAANP